MVAKYRTPSRSRCRRSTTRALRGVESEARLGQGDGEPGDRSAGGDPQQGQAQARPAKARRQELEVEVTLDELAAILGEELGLPRIEHARHAVARHEEGSLRQPASHRPRACVPFKQTFKRALRRQGRERTSSRRMRRSSGRSATDRAIAAGAPIRARNPRRHHLMMDVSGSWATSKKRSSASSRSDRYVATQPVQGPRVAYIIHDATARIVDR